MYVVTKSGKKLPVDTSSIKNETMYFQETVGLYSDDTILKPIWILELNKNAYYYGVGDSSRKNEPLDFVAEIRFCHEPSQEEILWAMSAHGLTRYDVAIVKKGFELDIESEY